MYVVIREFVYTESVCIIMSVHVQSATEPPTCMHVKEIYKYRNYGEILLHNWPYMHVSNHSICPKIKNMKYLQCNCMLVLTTQVVITTCMTSFNILLLKHGN